MDDEFAMMRPLATNPFLMIFCAFYLGFFRSPCYLLFETFRSQRLHICWRAQFFFSLDRAAKQVADEVK